MKKNLKNILKVLLIFILFTWLIFWYWYYKKVQRDLVDYSIQEKIIVKFKDDNNKYLLNLNDWSYIKYDWIFVNYNPINYEEENLFMETKIYNKNNKIIYSFLYPKFNQWYWSQNWKYLITREWFILRMFWLFLAKRSAWQTIAIYETETWKRIDLIIKGSEWDIKKVESILWYVLEN